jgi:5-bromo-4-chloroindolyl phosphate hydrolysis protein
MKIIKCIIMVSIVGFYSCIYYILKELDMLKMFKSPLTCSAREINIIRKKLKERYTKIRREKINLVKQNLVRDSSVV